MKTLRFPFILICLLMSTNMWMSCDNLDPFNTIPDDVIVDWSPVEINISVKDASGNDLLDTLSTHCVIESLTATFRGETYTVRTDCYDEKGNYVFPIPTVTRAYMPRWYGLCLTHQEKIWDGYRWNTQDMKNFMLYFGEIDGADDMDEDIVLTFPSGEKHVIHYHCSDHNEHKLKCNRWFSLDGKKSESSTFDIVLGK